MRYVRTPSGCYFVQASHDCPWGFALYADDQVFPGGFGLGETWEVVDDVNVPEEVKEQLGWLFDELDGE